MPVSTPERLSDGVLNIDKPAGWTSHDVVAKIRSHFKIKKVGHTGTLDPQATGVLPVCLGKGTKIASYLIESDKEYEAVLRLGVETDTQDATGRVTRTSPVPAYLWGHLSDTLATFVGTSLQMPPMYSAVKVGGVRLYRAARAGQVVERTPRPITIRSIEMTGLDGPDIAFRVVCSKGTYIRTLCADVGERLGVGGHLLALRRTRAGRFHIADAIAVESLLALYPDGGWEQQVCPLDITLDGLSEVRIAEEDAPKIASGVPTIRVIRIGAVKAGEALRILSETGRLLAVGRALADIDGSEMNGAQQAAPLFKIETVLCGAD